MKHSYLVTDCDDVQRVIREAFYICQTGRPGPVLVDLPKDVTSAEIEFKEEVEMDLPGYETHEEDNLEDIQKMADILMSSTRPLLYVGQGAILSQAADEVMELAEKLQAPVTTTLLGKGAFPETHDLSVGMLGMHGTAYANKAVVGCDLILSIGARWDDRITGKLSEFCKHAKKLHIDIDPAEVGKIVIPDVSVVGDAKLVLKKLLAQVSSLPTRAWLEQIREWKEHYPLKYEQSESGELCMQFIIDELYRQTNGEATITTDVGQPSNVGCSVLSHQPAAPMDNIGWCRNDGFWVSCCHRCSIRAT